MVHPVRSCTDADGEVPVIMNAAGPFGLDFAFPSFRKVVTVGSSTDVEELFLIRFFRNWD